MTSVVLYNQINPLTAVFSRTHFSFPMSKDFPTEICCSVKHKLKSRKQEHGQFKKVTRVRSSVAGGLQVELSESGSASRPPEKKLRVLVAGGGIGGLVFALAAKRKGFEVVVFEKDLSAIRGEGQYRGPIQIQSNALAALEAIDIDVAEEVMCAGCITGDRINGLVDGISGSWYVKFDTFTPAVERGLPVTRVISRMTLQEILAHAVGSDTIMNESNVVDFVDNGEKVTVKLENGHCYEGDVLVGADGIWSKVRKILFGPTEAIYSGYTCYTGRTLILGEEGYIYTYKFFHRYRVFLGHKQYFVSSDVGGGKMQWYAFHNESPGGIDVPKGRKERLLKLFEGWCDNVIDLLLATDEDAILRRDIYDRTPIFTWGKGRVTLLGDSVHAMQPNLGQGGCMAIEDGYQLALELDKAWRQSVKAGNTIDIVSSLKRYENARKVRVAIIHGLARMAAMMASTYKAYLGVGLGPLSFLTKYKIPHPGRVGGRIFIDVAMPLMLSWVLGGNGSKLEGRVLHCRLSDKASDQLRRWFTDNDALERALDADWFLLPVGGSTSASEIFVLSRDEKRPCIIGSVPHANSLEASITIPSQQVSEMHARISYKDGAFFLTDLSSKHGTWITDNEGRQYRVTPNLPTRLRPTDVIDFGSDKLQAAFRVKAMKTQHKSTHNEDETAALQAM
ncbi:zeaxanthin epoxidase, chloroplastic-like [Sesamum indicum]|uniref:Zeaxanthin epoxidase, chloroplastic n=1 Tax=Sesamum indicum TaxID=4182 RepID=A0A8M8V212_SESIN|nr:zeaxanthin epoxidase, chloroplastic-like [Sesamum indicum]